MNKVLILDNIHKTAKHVFERNGIRAEQHQTMPIDALVDTLNEGEFNGLLIRSSTKLSDPNVAAQVMAVPTLQVIGRAGSGVDNINLDVATENGIQVINAPGMNSIAVAEIVMGQAVNLARFITAADASTRSGLLDKQRFMGFNLFGKSMGIIGMGHVGREVAKRAIAFGMRIIAHDPHLPQTHIDYIRRNIAPNIEFAGLTDVIRSADVITLHTPKLKRETLDRNAFSIMKEGVRIINFARKGAVDEVALKEGLRSGRVGGAALDVFTDTFHKDPDFTAAHNVILTPHIGASTRESQIAVAEKIAYLVSGYLQNGSRVNAVNTPRDPRRFCKVAALAS